MATDQAGKLGVGKNNKIISIYSNYQVKDIRQYSSAAALYRSLNNSPFNAGRPNQQKSSRNKSDCHQKRQHGSIGEFRK